MQHFFTPGKVDEKATQLHAIASLKVSLFYYTIQELSPDCRSQLAGSRIGFEIYRGITMVFVLDGNSEHVSVRTQEIMSFFANNFIFAAAIDLNKCLEQVTLPI